MPSLDCVDPLKRIYLDMAQEILEFLLEASNPFFQAFVVENAY
jgi:hypothetical protein